MTIWYWNQLEVEKTPSLRDGIPADAEARYRRAGCRLIATVGNELIGQMATNTVATASVYFHRFYMFRSFKHFDHRVTAITCLFIAGKVEETPKKCRSVIAVAERHIPAPIWKSAFGDNPLSEVMLMEQVVITTLKFDLKLDHPYHHLLRYLDKVKGAMDDPGKAEICQMAWTFINDSFQTTLCIQWEPEVIALGLLFLAVKFNKTPFVLEPVEQTIDYSGRWWLTLAKDIPKFVIEAVCHRQLDIYSNTEATSTSGTSSPPPPTPLSARFGSTASTPASTDSPSTSTSTNEKQQPSHNGAAARYRWSHNKTSQGGTTAPSQPAATAASKPKTAQLMGATSASRLSAFASATQARYSANSNPNTTSPPQSANRVPPMHGNSAQPATHLQRQPITSATSSVARSSVPAPQRSLSSSATGTVVAPPRQSVRPTSSAASRLGAPHPHRSSGPHVATQSGTSSLGVKRPNPSHNQSGSSTGQPSLKLKLTIGGVPLEVDDKNEARSIEVLTGGSRSRPSKR